MADLKDQFLNKENFYLAFKRLSSYLQQSNEWYDPIELAEYEANLATNLFKLKKKVEEGKYFTHPLEPLPFPKKNNYSNEEQLRTYFKIHIEDQLVWIAVVNIIGHFLEEKMPFWSYGNRLFQPTWYEEMTDGSKQLIKGSYKNNSINLYRKWNQSWPFYRRHISMTIKTMGLKSSFDINDLDSDIEKKIFKEEETENFFNYKYLNSKFWKGRKSEKLYWTGLDFKNFFPSINPEVVIQNIRKAVVRDNGDSRDDTEFIFEIIEKLLHFPINKEGWDSELLLDNKIYGLKSLDVFFGVPTGLFVSGFLANVAMMDVDNLLDSYIENSRKIALFKFVDDQVILSNSKSELLNFLNFYKKTLENSNAGVEFQNKKTIPANTYSFNKKGFFIFKKDQDDFKFNEPSLDIKFPEPLMTHTLQKMSVLNDEDYDLLDEDEIEKTISDLKHFLLADFPDAEMKRETRMAFASMKLCLLSKQIKPNFRKLDTSLEENIRLFSNDITISEKDKKYNLQIEKIKNKHFNENFKTELKKVEIRFNSIFNLLRKAVIENPDKLKLWKRCIEFCYFTGFDGLNLILESIKKSTLHSEGKEYLLSYCLLLIQEKCISANSLRNTESISYWRSFTIEKYIKNVKKINAKFLNLNNPKPFFRQTLINFNYSLKFLENSNNHLKSEVFLWYVLSNLNNKEKLQLWENNINNINFDNPISWSLISLFPNKIPESIIDKIKDIDKKVDMSELIFENFEYRNRKNGVIYEMFENRIREQEMFLKYYPEISKVFKENKNLETHISLNLWLQDIIKQTEKESWIDVRLFEWSILEIIKQICQTVIKAKEGQTIFNINNDIYFVHPSNYLVPIEWLQNKKLTWVEWKDIVNSQKIELNKINLLIDDFRYFPSEKLWQSSQASSFFGSQDITLILQLSTLMVKLLSKSFIWPSYSNKVKFIDQHYNEVSNILETVSVSSDTRLLLSNIFSKSNLIDLGINNVFKLDEGRIINSIESFVLEIEMIQKKLEENHFALLNNTPRQLTIIDIDKLNKSKNIY